MDNFAFDKKTLWSLKMAELRNIVIANNIPKPCSQEKREYVSSILKFQGNYEEEEQKWKNERDTKHTTRKEYITNLLAAKRDEKVLNKLGITDLTEMLNYSCSDTKTIDKNLKGCDKKKAIISILMKTPNLLPNGDRTFMDLNSHELTKYQRHYVYPGHWFREDYEFIKSGFHNVHVQCAIKVQVFSKNNLMYAKTVI